MPVEAGDIRMNTPLGTVRAIAPRDADRLATLGLTTVGELIAHLPMRYEREEAESSIENLPADAVVSARGEVTATRVAGFGRKQRFEAVLHDGSGRLDLVWFSQPYLHRKIGAGTRLRIQGKSRRRGGGLQVANPRWELIDDGGGEPGSREARLRPVYPASEAIDSRSIESCVRSVLRPAIVRLEDHLSPELRRERELPALHDAFLMVHEPRDDGEIASGRRRLAYDELLLLQLGVQLKRAHRERTLAAPRIEVDGTLDARIRERFPFELTSAQEKVVAEIARDLARPIPANRLIQGDVGSGKTVVALYALLAAVAVGQQGVLMAPTSLLAEQHFLSISGMLEGSRVRVELLTGSLAAGERAGVLAALESGEIDVLIGTHALLTEGVRFDSLAVAVIDEQHRFGVRQRAALRTKGDAAGDKPVVPHTFVMTATPIPRTLAMTLLGDLDVSTIDGLPPGRTPVRTKVVGRDKR
ncbi:MAG: DEAD/DEAH box helicase, partial [Planctomycetota bacterium]